MITDKYYNRKEVEKDKHYLYLFTDNLSRTSGYNKIIDGWYLVKYNIKACYPNTTQATIRGLDNAYPISTMYDYNRTQLNDKYLDNYKAMLDEEIQNILDNKHKYRDIIYFNHQFGNSNISKMKQYAPKCWEYLNIKLRLLGIENEY